MVLVTSKTSAGRAAVVAGSPRRGGGEEGMAKEAFSGAGRAAPSQRTHASRRQQNDPADPASLSGVYSGGCCRPSGVCVASAGRLVPRCVSGERSAHDGPHGGTSTVCGCIVTPLSQAAAVAGVVAGAATGSTAGTDRVITSSEASGSG